MKKRREQTFVLFFSSLICFAMLPQSAKALPKHCEVVSGSAQVQEIDPHRMRIETSDKAILHYSHFDIGNAEKVTFVQPSNTSCLLNKVIGSNPSKILGHLESNGKIFLVNPQGVYFGPKAQVNVGSLIVSTLDISNEDFINENYQFSLGSNCNGLIRNEGSLTVSNEGSIVLMAPKICNLGVIEAKAGHVILTSGEHVTLDFSGDGLVSFSVEGSVKDALIENFGKIDSASGSISMKLPVAQKVIQEIVNQEGILEGDVFVEENGKIYLTSASSLLAQEISIEASGLVLEGKIDATHLEREGGSVHLFGREIFLLGATIDTSGLLGGGEVLIGGEFQGKGASPHALQVMVDSSSTITANALERGDGGLVVLWSQEQTLFDGTIFSQGGFLGGNGGLVETSSLGSLKVVTGIVDTKSPFGLYGDWLLDPAELTVSNSATTCAGDISTTPTYGSCCNTSDCPNCNIAVSTINASTVSSSPSNVTLQARNLISVLDAISMTNSGVGLTFEGCSDGAPLLSLSANITTKGGSVLVDLGMSVQIVNDITIDTTAGGSLGADVTMNELFTSSSSLVGLTVKGGSAGTVSVSTNVTGSGGDLSYINIESASQVKISQIVTQGDLGFSMPTSTPLVLTGTVSSIDTTAGGARSVGAPVTTGTINASSIGAQSLLIQTGAGLISIGAVGGTTPLGDVIISGSDEFILPSITTASGKIWIYPPATLSSSVALNTTASSSGADIHFFSTLDASAPGNQNLSLTAGSGDIRLDKAVGETVRVGTFSIVSAGNVFANAIVASSILQSQGLGTTIFEEALTTTSFGGVHVTGNRFVFKGAVTAQGSGDMQIVNSGLTLIEKDADILIGGSFAQSGGGRVFTSGDIQTVNASSSITFTDPVVVAREVSWQTNQGFILIKDRVDGPGSLTLDAGSSTVTFRKNMGLIIPLESLDVTASSVFLQGVAMKTLGSQSYHSVVTTEHGIVISSLSGDLTFDSSFDGTVNGVAASFSMGSGALTLNGLGLNHAMGLINIFNSGSVSTQGIHGTSLQITGGISAVELHGQVSLSGPLGLIIDEGSISLGAPITASQVFFRSRGVIKNLTTPNPITIFGTPLTTAEFLNAMGGNIGSASSPIEINVTEPMLLGANQNAYFTGSAPSLSLTYISSNTPCLVTYNGSLLRDCSNFLTAREIFNGIPKDLFYVPGLYSSWDNLSNDEYFFAENEVPMQSPRSETMFALKVEIRKETPLKKPYSSQLLELDSVIAPQEESAVIESISQKAPKPPTKPVLKKITISPRQKTSD